MPTYVYRFIDSGKIIEVQQAFTDEPFTTIEDPIDGEIRAVKKVFTPVGVSFKGDGFYKTDSRTKSSSPVTSAASTTFNGSESTSNGESSTKPAAASASETSPSPVSTPASSTPANKPATTATP
jgi:predicted nucleic acid-binding Zn ribbon protein